MDKYKNMQNSAIQQIGYDRCSSCFLCHDVCTKQAIEFKFDNEGFYKPYINPEKCNNCGLCSNLCPIINHKISSKEEQPIIYGGWNNNITIRARSSSGGLFFEIAKQFIQNSGVVCGVKWENGIPVFDIAKNVEELEAFIGSKYLQADATEIYRRVKNEIRQGIKVLFTGLPCQIQAINNYIDSSLLYTIDVVCAGVPSMLMYKKYCDEYLNGINITNVSFRTKNLNDKNRLISDWRNYSIEFYSGNKCILSEKHYKNRFFLAFNSTKCYNKACYECKFNTIPRRGNITLCDYWGATNEMDSKEGTSLLLVNDAKGETIVKTISANSIFLKEIKDDSAYLGTARLNMNNRNKPLERDCIFSTLNNFGFKMMFSRHLSEYTFKGKLLKLIKLLFK